MFATKAASFAGEAAALQETTERLDRVSHYRT